MDAKQYFIQHQDRLSKLPYYREGVLEHLAALIGGRTDLDALFSDDLHGDAPIFRLAALDYFSSNRSDEKAEIDQLEEGTHVYSGDLTIRQTANIQGCLVVLGDLVVEGNLLAFRDYPLIFVGGTLRCRNLYANEVEIICVGDLSATESTVLVYNHTVVVVDTLRTPLLVLDDAYPDGNLKADQQYDNGSYEVYRSHFGIEFDEDDDNFDAEEHILEPLIMRFLKS